MPKKLKPKKPKHSVTVNGYTYRWDSDDEDEMDAIFEAWGKRDWLAWLKEHLRFSFQAKRVEDDHRPFFEEGVPRQPFSIGSTMQIVGLSDINEDSIEFRASNVSATRVGMGGRTRG